MIDFIHLHTHTHYSLLSSPILPGQLFEKASSLKMKSIAITDHSAMFNMPELFSLAQAQNVKLIIGAEVFLAPCGRKEKTDREAHHLILLVKNKVGFQNLSKILSISAKEGFYYRPRADKELVFNHAEGLICLTACEKGELPKLIMSDKQQEADLFIEEYGEVFGEDFYLEMNFHHTKKEEEINQGLISLSEKHNKKLVAANDVHYLNKEDALLQEVMMALKNKHTLSNEKRLKFPTNEYYLKSAQEMNLVFDNTHNELSNTLEIDEKCSFVFKDKIPQLPVFKIPEGFKSDNEYLRCLTKENIEKKYGDLSLLGEKRETIEKRIAFELDTIEGMGFSSYFLIVADLIKASREMGYSVGPGRGSAAGSIVAYLIDITRVDPIEFNLLFERFLNPERNSMPDIDIDFTPEGKQKVLDYTVEKYGQESVSKVIAFSTLTAKAVMKNVGRVLEIPFEKMNELTKLVPSRPGVTLKSALEESSVLKKELNSKDPKINQLIKVSLGLEGRVRNVTVHAAGVVLTNGDLKNHVPLYATDKIDDAEKRYAKDEKQIVTQYDKKWIEKAGLLKIDYLGLATLSVIDETLHLIEKNYGKKIDLEKLPFDDAKTFEIFQSGKMSGIFQFESSGMQEYMVKLKPTSIGDIVAMSALYRPGTLRSKIDDKRNVVDLFIDRKNGIENVVYPHPLLEPVLNETYGIIVYQEQVMMASQILAGFSPAKADYLREAMGKKKVEMMEKFRTEFIEGSVHNGIHQKEAEKVFELMEKFSGYGFNKSHSVAYAALAYRTAYLKANYSAEFMTSVLNNEIGDYERTKVLIDEAKGMGLEFLPLSINKSKEKFSIEKKSGASFIRLGLVSAKHVGTASKVIITSREQRKSSFANLFEFGSAVDLRLVNKRCMESLIEAGAFDEIDPNRAKLFVNVHKVVEYGQSANKARTTGQVSFFDDVPSEEIIYPKMDEVEPWTKKEKLEREKNTLGFLVSEHYLDPFLYDYQAFTTLKFSDKEYSQNKNHRVMGAITEVKEHLDKKGRKMVFGTIEDFSGTAEFTIFSSVYEKHQTLIKENQVVMFVAEVSGKPNKLKLLVKDVIQPEKIRDNLVGRVQIKLDLIQEDAMSKAKKLKQICNKYAGNTPLGLEILINEKGKQETWNFFARRSMILVSNEALKELKNLVGKNSINLIPKEL